MVKENNKIKLHIMITLAVMIFIFVHSAMPGHVSGAESKLIVRIIVALTGLDSTSVGFAVRKCAHFTEYTVLGMCLLVNVSDWRKTIASGKKWLVSWVIGAAYAATDEFHQLFVVGRSGEIRDVCIDAAGVALGALIMLLFCIRKEKGSGSPETQNE